MARKRQRRGAGRRKPAGANGAPNIPPNPSLSMVQMPGPTSGKAQTDFIRRQYNYADKLFFTELDDHCSRTVSLIGGKDSGADARCITLGDCNHDDALKRDMERNQFFRIYQVEVTAVLSPATEYGRSPHFMEIATSAFEVLRPTLEDDRLLALTTYCALSIPQSSLIRTFKYSPNAYLKDLGIDWCPCDEWGQFSSHSDLYMKQLRAGFGSSALIRLRRPSAEPTFAECGWFWVRYFVEYKGQKGENSLG